MSSGSSNPNSLNFAFLSYYNPLLDRLGAQAERYFRDDPNTSLLKLRQFGELLAQTVAAKLGIFTSQREEQRELLRRLRDQLDGQETYGIRADYDCGAHLVEFCPYDWLKIDQPHLAPPGLHLAGMSR